MFEEFLAWPDRGAVIWTLPKCFEKKFRDCICIIDCSEVFIERPKNLIIAIQSNIWLGYSNWSGQFSSVWMEWKQIRQADNLAVWFYLEKITFGDLFLVRRSLNLHDEITLAGAALKIPCFTKGNSQ